MGITRTFRHFALKVKFLGEDQPNCIGKVNLSRTMKEKLQSIVRKIIIFYSTSFVEKWALHHGG